MVRLLTLLEDNMKLKDLLGSQGPVVNKTLSVRIICINFLTAFSTISNFMLAQ